MTGLIARLLVRLDPLPSVLILFLQVAVLVWAIRLVSGTPLWLLLGILFVLVGVIAIILSVLFYDEFVLNWAKKQERPNVVSI